MNHLSLQTCKVIHKHSCRVYIQCTLSYAEQKLICTDSKQNRWQQRGQLWIELWDLSERQKRRKRWVWQSAAGSLTCSNSPVDESMLLVLEPLFIRGQPVGRPASHTSHSQRNKTQREKPGLPAIDGFSSSNQLPTRRMFFSATALIIHAGIED